MPICKCETETMAKKFDLVAIGTGVRRVGCCFAVSCGGAAGRETEEVINLFAVAMRSGMRASDLKQMLFAHPTHGSNLPYMLKNCPETRSVRSPTAIRK